MEIEPGAAGVVGEAFAEFAGGDDEAGAGEGGSPFVRVLSGKALTTAGRSDVVADFFAGRPEERGGARVAVTGRPAARSHLRRAWRHRAEISFELSRRSAGDNGFHRLGELLPGSEVGFFQR